MKPNVHLHIDRLVLDSAFAHLDRTAVGAAVEAELARLLAEQEAPAALQNDARVARIDGGQFDAAPGAGVETIGRQVAQRIFGGLNA